MIPQTHKKGRHRRTTRIFRVGRDGSEIHPAHAATRRAVDHPGRVNAVVPQGGDEVQRLPVAVRHARIKTLLAQVQPRSGAMLVLIQVSSMKTGRLGSTMS